MAATARAPTRHDIFASVFPPANFTTPTPETTPNIGVLASPGRPFGGFNIPPPAIDEAVRFNRAWSAATRYLSLQYGDAPAQQSLEASHHVTESMYLLCREARTRKELLAWYANEVGFHCRQHVRPNLSAWEKPVPRAEVHGLLSTTVELLDEAQRYYLQKLERLALGGPDADVRAVFQLFRTKVAERLHVQVLQSLPVSRVQDALAVFFHLQMKDSLALSSNPEACSKRRECHCALSMDSIDLGHLHDVGLGGAIAERAFSQAMHRFLQGAAITRRCFQVDWSEKTTVVPMSRRWVHDHVTPFVTRSLAKLTGNAHLAMSQSDADRFAQIAIMNLGRQRTAAVFDYVKSWPASTGAFLDIQEYLSCTPQDKAHVCESFITQAKHRLLHAGACTTDILSIYANVIHAFRLLDSRGVLLEKVAGPLRSYLRGRDDTVAIIAASFLADLDADGNAVAAESDKVCADITAEVAHSTLVETREQHRTLRYDDMTWTPDPIDAGPDYKASKSEDVLAYVLGLFDPEDFLKEVTTVLAQHLLQAPDPEYVKETRLVELFKTRLDATKLQAAEVMLKDVRDSVGLNRRINSAAKADLLTATPTPRDIQAVIPEEGMPVKALWELFNGRMAPAQFHAALKVVATKRGERYFAKRTRLPAAPPEPHAAAASGQQGVEFKVQVLSSFFWPRLRASAFAIPADLAQRERGFAERFAQLGNQRKLHFRPALARVDIELQLEDRRVVERGVPVWRASVVEAFATKQHQQQQQQRIGEEGGEAATTYTAEELGEDLQMDAELVLDALTFWAGQRVLYTPQPQSSPGTYAVLEHLSLDTAPTTQPVADPGVSAVQTQDALLRESAPVFATFIAEMLRNGGARGVGGAMGITGMLRMVLPGFTYGEAETMWVLEGMEGRGEVERRGELWGVKA
ncbi:hypothetical protein LTR53_002190 [Teratosphaeriaceae sp. CCFEE 6253]|nr:hypothetical protein LTR53_002190 [Teratosphaeriaceae sp. CCFEE 6253]